MRTKKRLTLALLATAVSLCAVAAIALLPADGLASEKDATAMPDIPSHAAQHTTPKYSESGHNIALLTKAEIAVLAAKLGEEAFKITQKSGTERPFCGTLLDNKKDGLYACVVCGLPLFSSEHKFTSGTGWPSFFQPYDAEHVVEDEDTSHGSVRTEISCARCDAHLGHVFPDGPPPTGRRHCLNSAALEFLEKNSPIQAKNKPVATETAYFAGGCFWGIEHFFQQGPGVLNAESGYMQGNIKDPTYTTICNSDTGHAESVKVVFDPSKISYRRLLEAFFAMHDPTQRDRQGPDVGSQYRSGIWWTTKAQQTRAQTFLDERQDAGAYSKPIATQIEQASTFYPAEDYHQNYVEKTGQQCHIADPWGTQATPSTK